MKQNRILSTMLLCIALAGCQKQTTKPQVGIIQIVEHPSLNTIREGIILELEEQGYLDKVELTYQNAQGDLTILQAIVQTMKGKQVDVVVPIATTTAQAAANLADTTPVVFAAVSNPIAAGLITNLDHPDKNITGTSDAVPVKQILELALELLPHAKTIGFLYNQAEVNSLEHIAQAKIYAKEKGLRIEEISVTSISEIQQSANVLASKVDFIFTPNDNTVASSMAPLVKAADDAKIPVFVGADSMVADGGLATLGINNYEELGRETARMVIAVLEGKAVSEIPVTVFREQLTIYINEKTREKLGLTIPDTITKHYPVVFLGGE